MSVTLQHLGVVLFRRTVITLALGLVGGITLWSGEVSPTLARAEELHERTDYNASLALLDQHSTDASTNFLIARNYFMLGDFKKSVEYLQKATAEAPNKAEYFDWLGRAYGKRAETGSPLTAPAFATRARQAFEKSIELNDKDPDALSDLFDYYLDAPGLLGGGYDKAAEVAKKIALVDPAEGFFEQAKLAQKRKEFDTAELHIRQAVAAAPKKAGALLVLARFLASEGRTHESDAVLAEAQQIDPNLPAVWFTKADLLIRQNRDLPEAKSLLERYLQATITPDDPSKDDAARLLKQANGGV